MSTLFTTTCAIAIASSAPTLGVTPERFATSLQQAMEQQRVAFASVEGKIKRIGDGHFVLLLANGDLFRVEVSDTTIFKLDGKTSTGDDALEVGRQTTVTHEDHAASRVEVSTK